MACATSGPAISDAGVIEIQTGPAGHGKDVIMS